MSLPMSGALWRALAVSILLSFLAGAPLAGPGGPDHSHGPEEAPGAAQPHPRFVAEPEMRQFVGVFRTGVLTLYLDRQAGNVPVGRQPCHGAAPRAEWRSARRQRRA